MRRPALWSAFCFAAGIGMQIWLKLPLTSLIWAGGIICGCIWIGIWQNWRPNILSAILAGCLAVLGGVRYVQSVDANASSFLKFLPARAVEIDVVAVSEPELLEDDYRAVYALSRMAVGDTVRYVSGKVLIRFRSGAWVPQYGENLRVQLALYRPSPPR